MHSNIPLVLSGAVVTARIKGLMCLLGTNIRGFKCGRAKIKHGITLPYSARHYIRQKLKEWSQNPNKSNKQKSSTHILLDRRELRQERREEMEICMLSHNLPWKRQRLGERDAIPDPNQHVGHYDRASKQHKSIPTTRSDAVVIARSKGTL